MTECNCNEVNAMAFKCWDCNTCTLCNDEYYMVDDELWKSATIFAHDPIDTCVILCIGCLENRIGGKLVPSDFPDYPINRGVFPFSPRLQSRLTNTN